MNLYDSDSAKYGVNPVSDDPSKVIDIALDIALSTITNIDTRERVKGMFLWAMQIPSWRDAFLKQFFNPPVFLEDAEKEENIIDFINIFSGICKEIITVNPSLSPEEQEIFWRKIREDAMARDLWNMDLKDYKRKYGLK